MLQWCLVCHNDNNNHNHNHNNDNNDNNNIMIMIMIMMMIIITVIMIIIIMIMIAYHIIIADVIMVPSSSEATWVCRRAWSSYARQTPRSIPTARPGTPGGLGGGGPPLPSTFGRTAGGGVRGGLLPLPSPGTTAASPPHPPPRAWAAGRAAGREAGGWGAGGAQRAATLRGAGTVPCGSSVQPGPTIKWGGSLWLAGWLTG